MVQYFFKKFSCERVIMMEEAKESRVLIGKRIRRLREKQGYLQDTFAKKIGAKRSAISNYENGMSAPQPYMLVIISKVLNTTVDYLVGASDNPSPRGENGDVSNQIELNEISSDTLFLDGEKVTDQELATLIAFLRTTRQLNG